MSLEQLKLQTSNFVHGLATRRTNLQVTNCPRSGRGQGQVANFRISHPLKYLRNGSETVQIFVVKFCVVVGYIKC